MLFFRLDIALLISFPFFWEQKLAGLELKAGEEKTDTSVHQLIMIIGTKNKSTFKMTRLSFFINICSY